MNLWANSKHKGFTIIELLIVIAVIAVLAMITILAFTGIQNRAQNTKIINSVEPYIDALKLYQADNGQLPEYGASYNLYRCLGEGYIDGRCAGIGVNPACGFGIVQQNIPFNESIRPYFSNRPMTPPLTDPLQCSQGPILGSVYVFRSATQTSEVYYFLKGDAECVEIAGVKVSKNISNEVTSCRLFL